MPIGLLLEAHYYYYFFENTKLPKEMVTLWVAKSLCQLFVFAPKLAVSKHLLLEVFQGAQRGLMSMSFDVGMLAFFGLATVWAAFQKN